MSHYFINDDNVNHNIQKHTITFNNKEYNFLTDNGVFAKRGLDYGTNILLEALIKEDIKGSVLDLGCGYGPVGIILASIFNITPDLVDINETAITLSLENMSLNNVKGNAFISDGYSCVSNKYNYIITNPPIRAGKKKVYELIFEAKNYLMSNGELWLVIRKQQGAKSLLNDLSTQYLTKVITKSKGYFVIKCQNR